MASPPRGGRTMRASRRLVLSATTTLALVASVAALAVGATGAQAAPPATAYDRAQAADAARQARMDAREVPRQGLSVRSKGAAPSIFQSPRDVPPISQDGLPGGELNTQVEPDLAMDPNNPDNVVAVVQQCRFKTGGTVDPGFAASLDGGHTWTHGNLPGLTTAVGGPFDRGSDPTVVFGI